MKLKELYMIYQAQKFREKEHSELNYKLSHSFYWNLFLEQEDDKERFITLGNLISLQIEYNDIGKAKNYLEIAQYLLKDKKVKNDILFKQIEKKYEDLSELVKGRFYSQ